MRNPFTVNTRAALVRQVRRLGARARAIAGSRAGAREGGGGVSRDGGVGSTVVWSDRRVIFTNSFSGCGPHVVARNGSHTSNCVHGKPRRALRPEKILRRRGAGRGAGLAIRGSGRAAARGTAAA
jgi:hypothetical protein